MRNTTRKAGLPRMPKGLKIPGLAGLTGLAAPGAAEDRLTPLAAPFRNPGKLAAYAYVPDGLAPGAPLVVVLHGCTQNAAGYDHGSGWSRLADRHGFALLVPEQSRANNPNLCFNWYEPGDSRRGRGEAASIAAMVEAMCAAHRLDPARVFVTGLSAGGAMASVMLAAYPELFAAGAIIAGLPFGCASGLAEAFGCMAGQGDAADAELAARVRRASPHEGPWPRVSVWHGSADRTVSPDNADTIVRQWAALHGVAPAPSRSETVDGHRREIWEGPAGEPLVERYLVAGMGHGTPISPGAGAGRSGAAMPHMLDVGLSSTDRIAAFFGLAPEPAAERQARPEAAEAGAKVKGEARAAGAKAEPAMPRRRAAQRAPAAAGGIRQTIEDALKAAGLMR